MGSMSTSSRRKASTRPYLRHDDRRRMLLETATQIVETAGWPALSMVALAQRSGTSRQLVYQHFANLDELLARTAWTIFNPTMERTRNAMSAHLDNLPQAVRAASRVTLDLPDGRGDALWQLIAGTGGSDALQRVSRGVREMLLDLWGPLVSQTLDLPPRQARLLAWSMIMSFWGLRQLIRDGAVSRRSALDGFQAQIERLLREPD